MSETTREFLIAMFFFTLINYSLTSFYFVEINFAKWSEDGRLLFCTIEVFSLFLCAGVAAQPRNK